MGINHLHQILKHTKLIINCMYNYFKFDFCQQIVIRLGSYVTLIA